MIPAFKSAATVLILTVSFAGSVAAGPFEAAVEAYEKGATREKSATAPETGVAAQETGSYAKALRLLSPLAQQGDPSAQYNLGLMFDNGQGLAQDYATAVTWYRKAAEQGHAAAQTNLGAMYARGQGVPQDYLAAASWYRKAAEQGYAMAQYNIGVMYEYGQGVPQDYTVAIDWYRKAAEQGYVDAQINLGIFYSMGEGVSRDYVIAHMWFSLAAAGGDTGAGAQNKMTPAQAREIVAKRMTPTQIAEAQKLAHEWKPTSTLVAPGSAPISELGPARSPAGK
jgi:uncharacterized protein